jgi:NAD(P)H dehydrogenase (quinone)
MKISVILAHPDPKSFNTAMAEMTVSTLQKNGHEVLFHDLYAQQFDPLLYHEEFPQDAVVPDHIRLHCEQIADADGIVIIHPNWWGQPPAILKGWVDRVIRPGIAYRFDEGDSGEGIPIGLLKARAVIVLNTSNTTAEREDTVFGDPLELIWKECIFGLCGIENFYRKMFRIVITSSPQQRNEWLLETAEIMKHYFPAVT